MGKKYTIKLRGTNCYLRNISENAINFTTDVKKAKVFERVPERMDIIDKLNAREFVVKGQNYKSDSIHLTMDSEPCKNLYKKHFYQIQEISDCRLNIHQYSLSLVNKFKMKAEAGDSSNFNCNYYGEDFERELIK
jgi:hypothetical protein